MPQQKSRLALRTIASLAATVAFSSAFAGEKDEAQPPAVVDAPIIKSTELGPCWIRVNDVSMLDLRQASGYRARKGNWGSMWFTIYMNTGEIMLTYDKSIISQVIAEMDTALAACEPFRVNENNDNASSTQGAHNG